MIILSDNFDKQRFVTWFFVRLRLDWGTCVGDEAWRAFEAIFERFNDKFWKKIQVNFDNVFWQIFKISKQFNSFHLSNVKILIFESFKQTLSQLNVYQNLITATFETWFSFSKIWSILENITTASKFSFNLISWTVLKTKVLSCHKTIKFLLMFFYLSSSQTQTITRALY